MSLDSVSLSQILCYFLKIGFIRSSLDCYCSSPIICSPDNRFHDPDSPHCHCYTEDKAFEVVFPPVVSRDPCIHTLKLVSKLKLLDFSLPLCHGSGSTFTFSICALEPCSLPWSCVFHVILYFHEPVYIFKSHSIFSFRLHSLEFLPLLKPSLSPISPMKPCWTVSQANRTFSSFHFVFYSCYTLYSALMPYSWVCI